MGSHESPGLCAPEVSVPPSAAAAGAPPCTPISTPPARTPPRSSSPGSSGPNGRGTAPARPRSGRSPGTAASDPSPRIVDPPLGIPTSTPGRKPLSTNACCNIESTRRTFSTVSIGRLVSNSHSTGTSSSGGSTSVTSTALTVASASCPAARSGARRVTVAARTATVASRDLRGWRRPRSSQATFAVRPRTVIVRRSSSGAARSSSRR